MAQRTSSVTLNKMGRGGPARHREICGLLRPLRKSSDAQGLTNSLLGKGLLLPETHRYPPSRVPEELSRGLPPRGEVPGKTRREVLGDEGSFQFLCKVVFQRLEGQEEPRGA